MRYLKLYENFSNKDDVRYKLESSLVELKDRGFEVDVSISHTSLIVEIKKKGDPDVDTDEMPFHQGWSIFSFDEIKEDIIQLSDYIKPSFYKQKQFRQRKNY